MTIEEIRDNTKLISDQCIRVKNETDPVKKDDHRVLLYDLMNQVGWFPETITFDASDKITNAQAIKILFTEAGWYAGETKDGVKVFELIAGIDKSDWEAKQIIKRDHPDRDQLTFLKEDPTPPEEID